MSIEFRCECGKRLRVPDSAGGRRGKCPQCGAGVTVPMPDIEADEGLLAFKEPVAATPPRVVAAKPVTAPAMVVKIPPPTASSSDGRPYRYLLLLVTLLPLVWSTIRPQSKTDLEQRFVQTLTEHPEIEDRIHEGIAKDELLAALPEHKIDGALLAYDTYVHWLFAMLSGAGFVGLILLLFPPGHTKAWHLVLIAALTGTAGIFLLLAFQLIAAHMPLFRGGSLAILLDVIWLIGQSYSMADGDHGFVLSAIGFTAGVGFCEETCKAIPLLWKARSSGFVSWRSAMLWGLISGVGFGVSEGIKYSGESYNGLLGGNIYLVRFISCVALHGIWSAAVGINIFRRQDYFRGQLGALEWLMQIAITVIVPMVLHGMYDTLLKQGYDGAALAVAVGSFGWLAWQIELAKRVFDETTPRRGFEVVR